MAGHPGPTEKGHAMNVNLLIGDITTFQGDVIVNAANPALLGGGGVDGAIHRAAGPDLRYACSGIPESSEGVRCSAGQVRPTPAFDLPCKWVFHTVGPIWALKRAGPPRPGEIMPPKFQVQTNPPASLAGGPLDATLVDSEAVLRRQLRECFKKAGVIAMGMDLQSIAFPALSTGIYGCPHETCAGVALTWCKDYESWPLDVTFYIYPGDSYGTWVTAYRSILGHDPWEKTHDV